MMPLLIGLFGLSVNANAVPAPSEVKTELKQEALVAHSIKRLDVAGVEMILLQMFVGRSDVVVKSTDDMLGLTQKDKQIALYMDFHQVPHALKQALLKKDYIRDATLLQKLLKDSFVIKDTPEVVTVKLKN